MQDQRPLLKSFPTTLLSRSFSLFKRWLLNVKPFFQEVCSQHTLLPTPTLLPQGGLETRDIRTHSVPTNKHLAPLEVPSLPTHGCSAGHRQDWKPVSSGAAGWDALGKHSKDGHGHGNESVGQDSCSLDCTDQFSSHIMGVLNPQMVFGHPNIGQYKLEFNLS